MQFIIAVGITLASAYIYTNDVWGPEASYWVGWFLVALGVWWGFLLLPLLFLIGAGVLLGGLTLTDAIRDAGQRRRLRNRNKPNRIDLD